MPGGLNPLPTNPNSYRMADGNWGIRMTPPGQPVPRTNTQTPGTYYNTAYGFGQPAARASQPGGPADWLAPFYSSTTNVQSQPALPSWLTGQPNSSPRSNPVNMTGGLPPQPPQQMPSPMIRTGINVGNVMDAGPLLSGMNSYAQQFGANNPAGGYGNPDLDRLLGDNMRGQMSQQSLAQERNMAQGNAQQLLNSQMANAQSGLGMGKYAGQQMVNTLTNQAAQRNMMMSLLQSIMGGM